MKISDPKPIALFDDYLFGKVEGWRAAGKEVLLAIDANENVYHGKFAKRLAEVGVELTSAYSKVHEKKMPTSHSRGTLPIKGFFSSPGIDIEAYFIG